MSRSTADLEAERLHPTYDMPEGAIYFWAAAQKYKVPQSAILDLILNGPLEPVARLVQADPRSVIVDEQALLSEFIDH